MPDRAFDKAAEFFFGGTQSRPSTDRQGRGSASLAVSPTIPARGLDQKHELIARQPPHPLRRGLPCGVPSLLRHSGGHTPFHHTRRAGDLVACSSDSGEAEGNCG